MTQAPRVRAQAIAARRGEGHTLTAPLGLRLAAKIGERPWQEFLTEPTQLANGLGDLLAAVSPDGLVVTLPEILAEDPDGTRLEAAIEATRRLRTTVGDSAALVALLPATAELVETAKAFLDAGTDGLVLPAGVPDDAARTIGNVARFHRAMAHVFGDPAAELPAVVTAGLKDPGPQTGLVLTETDLPEDTPIPLVADWVAAVRG
jgi:hypothetical protein